MVASYATGLIGIAAILLVWVSVQNAWRRTFPGAFDDPDPLAERLGCDGCDRRDECDHVTSAARSEETEGT